jgi:hypothetical protein
MNSLMVFDENRGLQMQSISSCSNSIVASGVSAIGVAGATSAAAAAAFDADFRAGISRKNKNQ